MMTNSLNNNKQYLWSNLLRSYWIYVLILGFFFYVSFTSVRAGDDWEISTWYNNGLLATFFGVVRAVLYFNGRIANNFFDSFFGYYSYLWNITAPVIFTGIIYLSAKIFNYEHKIIPILINFVMILSVSDAIRVETYTNLIGNTSYIIVIFLILLFIHLFYRVVNGNPFRIWQNEKINFLTALLFAFVIGLWIENTTIGFAVALLTTLVIFIIKKRNISPYITYSLIGIILSCGVMFASPGYYIRLASMSDSTVDIKQRVLINLPEYLKLLVTDNLTVYLIFLIVFLALLLGKKNTLTSKVLTKLLVVFISLQTVIVVAKLAFDILVANYYAVNFPSVADAYKLINSWFFDSNNLTSKVFIAFILIITILPLFLFIKNEKIVTLFVLGITSAGVMLGSPYLGARTFVLAIFLLAAITSYLVSLIEINSHDFKLAVILLLILLIGIQADKFFLYGSYVTSINSIRERIISDYLSEMDNSTTQDKWIVLPAYKDKSIISTANPNVTDGHMIALKKYYHLPDNVNVIIDDGFAVKNFNVSQVKGNDYHFEVEPLKNVSSYTYTFSIQSNGKEINRSSELLTNFEDYTFTNSGVYTIACILSNHSGEAKKIIASQEVVIP